MLQAITSLTPVARIDNLADRVTGLRGQVYDMGRREYLSVTLREDLAKIRSVLDRCSADITATAGLLGAIHDIGHGIDDTSKSYAHDAVLKVTPWLDYAEARITAANIMFQAHKPNL